MAKSKNVSKPARTTPPVRVSYPQVFTARAVQAGQDPKYGVVMMFDKSDQEHKDFIKALHADMTAARNEHWSDPAKCPRTELVGATDSPIKDGDKTVNRQGIPLKETNEEYAGHWILRASTKAKPVVVDRNMAEILDSNEVYGGCFCKVNINAYTYDVNANKGVTVGLNGIQKWADGDSFGGGRPPVSDMFESAGADDPANYASGDDPFDGAAPVANDDDISF